MELGLFGKLYGVEKRDFTLLEIIVDLFLY